MEDDPLSTNEPVRILGFAGSARKASYNKALVKIALRGAEEAGAKVTLIDLRDFPMPLYDGDLESEKGLPEAARELKAGFQAAAGFLIASPEYNGFFSPLMKNSLDWLSRTSEASPDPSAFQQKTAALLSASPSPLGGLRGLRGLRELLTNLGVTVLPNQLTLRNAFKAFDSDGQIVDDAQAKRVESIGAELTRLTQKLTA